MSSRRLLLPLFLLFVLLAACEFRPLEVVVDEKVRVRVIVKWQVNFVELYGISPNGMTVMIWPASGGVPIVRTTNADHITVLLEPGSYHMLIFNELTDDYAPYLRFYDADSYERMACRATSFTVVASTRAWDAGATYMYTPEEPRISVALDTFDITRDMVLQDTTIFIPFEEYRDNGYVSYRESEHVFEIPETTWPMTVDLFVRLRIKHRQSLASIEGSISGLADGFYLSQIRRTSETGTIRLNPDQWERIKLGDDADSLGLVTTRVASFGLPYGKELLELRDSADNILTLCFGLANDSLVFRQFKVGKNIKYITPEGREALIRYRQDLRNLELVLDLPDIINLPHVTPAEGAMFDARVDEWEDGGTLDLIGF